MKPQMTTIYCIALEGGAKIKRRFLFGPAFDDAEIARQRARFLSAQGFARTSANDTWPAKSSS